VLARALNALLPDAIRVLDCREAPDGFDARRWAVRKRYLYLIDEGPVADPFLRRYAWHVPQRLDAEAMGAAFRHLRGTHDFSAFCAAPGRGRIPTCTILSARVIRRRNRLAILVSADSFLHRMVRNITGTLVETGRGSRDPASMAAVLEARERGRAGPTAPPRGLTLLRVLYPR
jgi:tRNA pseudouridine38-40 synthase